VPETLVLLHGFGGTRRAWDAVVPELGGERYRPVALDLRGHGEAADAEPSFEGCLQDVLAVAPERFALCGYSLGGRIAQQVALAAPERVTRLVLVSTTAGIDDPDERAARRAADVVLAEEIEAMSPEEWAERWMSVPLFAGTPPDAAARWREDLLRNDPRRIAAVLRALGAGVMTPLWDRLGELEMPVTVVVGERDAKYRALADRYRTLLSRVEVVVIPGAGHGLPREAPRELAAAILGEPS